MQQKARFLFLFFEQQFEAKGLEGNAIALEVL